jgi:hypothetical protein
LTALAVLPASGWAAWKQPVGGPKPLNRGTSTAYEPSLASVAGVPYVAWEEFDPAAQSKLWVSRLNAAGTAWEPVGGAAPLNIDPAKHAEEASLAEIGGVLYVAWSETDGTNKEIRVKRLDALANAWVPVGAGASPINQAPDKDAIEPSLASIGGVPYVAWREAQSSLTDQEVRVARLNDTGTAWEKVGQTLDPASPINESATQDARHPSLASVGGVPHVAWAELDGVNYEVRVARLNGPSTGWDPVVSGASPVNQAADRNAFSPSLTAVGSVPHVAWQEETAAGVKQVRVSRLNGAGTAWQQVGTGCPGAGCTSPINHVADRDGFRPSLIAIGGVPYVAWEEFELAGMEIRVSRLNAAGTAWVQVVGGPDPITEGVDTLAKEQNLTSIGGVPYIAWTEHDGSAYQVRVSRLEPDFLGASETVGETSATLTTQVRTYGVAYPIGFQYGAGASLSSTTPTAIAESGNGDSVTVNQTISGLSPATDYSWRPVGSDGTRTTGAGATRAFKTAGSDTVPPVAPTITGTSPPSPDPDTAPEVLGTAEAGSTVRLYTTADCSGAAVASGNAAAFASPGFTVTAPAGGSATFRATATDVAGNVSPCSAGLTYQTVSDTRLTSGPDGPTNDPTPTFAFAAEPAAGATFECSVDRAAFAACGSPLTTPPLADGPHGMRVRAVTGAGVADPSPATRDFFVDTVAPGTVLTVSSRAGLGRRIGDGETYSGYVDIGRSAQDPEPSGGVSELLCVLDPAAAPVRFEDIAGGSCPLITDAAGDHTVYAASRDLAGNVGPVASARFEILGPPETSITGGPAGKIWNTTPSFAFTSDTAGATFQCRVDAGAWAPCTSPFRTAPITGTGAHFFQVAAISREGVIDPTPARRDFSLGPVETHALGCKVAPFRQPPNSLNGCTVEPMDQPCTFVYPSCSTATPPCPIGARCTFKTRVFHADQDGPGLGWYSQAWVTFARPLNGSSFQSPGAEAAPAVCTTRSGPAQCSGASSAISIIGDGRSPYFVCNSVTAIVDSSTATMGPDAARILDCGFTMEIRAAASLDTVTQGESVTVHVTQAGTLTVAPTGSSRARTSAVAKVKPRRKTAPLFKATKKTVRRAGPVTFKLALSKAARATLKRRKRLVLALRLTFKPKSGKAQTRTLKVVLRPPPKAPTRPRP